MPPINIRSEEAETAFALVRRAASALGPIRLSLGPPATFLPDAPVVYLAVGGDLDDLDVLRRALETSPLVPPRSRPLREFVPHVTLDQRADPTRVPAVLQALADYRADVVVDRATVLEFDEPARRWRPVAEAPFARPHVAGRGGIEIELRSSTVLDPAELDFRTDAWERYEQATYGDRDPAETFAITARVDGELVGTATGQLQGNEPAYLGHLIVSEAWRSFGVGSQLLRAVERLAQEKGAPSVRLLARKSGLAAAFYEAKGYRSIARIPTWRFGHDFVVLERALGSQSQPT